MHSDYSEWTMDSLFRTKKCLLKTLDYINDNKGRNDGKSYTSSQLDDMEHILAGLHRICELKKMHMDNEAMMAKATHVHTHIPKTMTS